MSVLLIDDHFCARDGIAILLKQIYPELQVWQADTLEEGMQIAQTTALSMVLLDIQLPGQNGLSGLQTLRSVFPNLAVVMFSGLDDSQLVFDSLRLGAMGFITKSLPRQAFVDALCDVMLGKVYLPATVVGRSPGANLGLLAHDDSYPVSDHRRFGLTPREFDVMKALVQGHCNKEIGRRLGIEEQTVRNHLRPIYQKFSVTTRTELLVKVFELGIEFGKPPATNPLFG